MPKILSDEERKAIRDKWTAEMLEQYDGIMALDDCYLELADEDIDAAIEFDDMYRHLRTEKVARSGLLTREKVMGFFKEFINDYNNGSNTDDV